MSQRIEFTDRQVNFVLDLLRSEIIYAREDLSPDSMVVMALDAISERIARILWHRVSEKTANESDSE